MLSIRERRNRGCEPANRKRAAFIRRPFLYFSDRSVVVLVSLVVVAKSICFTKSIKNVTDYIHPLLSQRCYSVDSTPEPSTQIQAGIRSRSASLDLRRDGYPIHLHRSSLCVTNACTPQRESSFGPEAKNTSWKFALSAIGRLLAVEVTARRNQSIWSAPIPRVAKIL